MMMMMTRSGRPCLDFRRFGDAETGMISGLLASVVYMGIMSSRCYIMSREKM
ncbi:Os08g0518050 [Oryza sativa Japonica Group]|uniref:Os08g0518050 protein n=1 Tax=Oryza sativa subsp. japonica TaxID=39947 RepID=C7J6A4_ORYSJ|nr:Os08g0518050 [Oryza sativa Japonica Group]|eukprot:NP_001175659.1 Os08g0518050 [Oryza sativa Japonica Group]